MSFWGGLAAGIAQGIDPGIVGRGLGEAVADYRENKAKEAAEEKKKKAIANLDLERFQSGGAPQGEQVQLSQQGAPQVDLSAVPNPSAQASGPSAQGQAIDPQRVITANDVKAGNPMSDATYDRRMAEIENEYKNANQQARADYYRFRGMNKEQEEAEKKLKDMQFAQKYGMFHKKAVEGDRDALKVLIGYANQTMGNGMRIDMQDDGKMSLYQGDKLVNANFVPSRAQLDDMATRMYVNAKFADGGSLNDYLEQQATAVGITSAKRSMDLADFANDRAERRLQSDIKQREFDQWEKTYALGQKDRDFLYQTKALGGGGYGGGGYGGAGGKYRDPYAITYKTEEGLSDGMPGNFGRLPNGTIVTEQKGNDILPAYMTPEQVEFVQKVRADGGAVDTVFDKSTGRAVVMRRVEPGVYQTMDGRIIRAGEATNNQASSGGGSGAALVRPNVNVPNYGFPPGFVTAAERLGGKVPQGMYQNPGANSVLTNAPVADKVAPRGTRPAQNAPEQTHNEPRYQEPAAPERVAKEPEPAPKRVAKEPEPAPKEASTQEKTSAAPTNEKPKQESWWRRTLRNSAGEGDPIEADATTPVDDGSDDYYGYRNGATNTPPQAIRDNAGEPAKQESWWRRTLRNSTGEGDPIEADGAPPVDAGGDDYYGYRDGVSNTPPKATHSNSGTSAKPESWWRRTMRNSTGEGDPIETEVATPVDGGSDDYYGYRDGASNTPPKAIRSNTRAPAKQESWVRRTIKNSTGEGDPIEVDTATPVDDGGDDYYGYRDGASNTPPKVAYGNEKPPRRGEVVQQALTKAKSAANAIRGRAQELGEAVADSETLRVITKAAETLSAKLKKSGEDWVNERGSAIVKHAREAAVIPEKLGRGLRKAGDAAIAGAKTAASEVADSWVENTGKPLARATAKRANSAAVAVRGANESIREAGKGVRKAGDAVADTVGTAGKNWVDNTARPLANDVSSAVGRMVDAYQRMAEAGRASAYKYEMSRGNRQKAVPKNITSVQVLRALHSLIDNSGAIKRKPAGGDAMPVEQAVEILKSKEAAAILEQIKLGDEP